MTRFRWVVCALLFAGTTINYVDRQILALLKPLLDHYKATGRGESAGYGILYGICSSAYVIAFLVSHLIAPRFERVRLQPT